MGGSEFGCVRSDLLIRCSKVVTRCLDAPLLLLPAFPRRFELALPWQTGDDVKLVSGALTTGTWAKVELSSMVRIAQPNLNGTDISYMSPPPLICNPPSVACMWRHAGDLRFGSLASGYGAETAQPS